MKKAQKEKLKIKLRELRKEMSTNAMFTLIALLCFIVITYGRVHDSKIGTWALLSLMNLADIYTTTKALGKGKEMDIEGELNPIGRFLMRRFKKYWGFPAFILASTLLGVIIYYYGTNLEFFLGFYTMVIFHNWGISHKEEYEQKRERLYKNEVRKRKHRK